MFRRNEKYLSGGNSLKIKIDEEKFLEIVGCDFCPQDLGFVLTKRCDYNCYTCWETALKDNEVKECESEN